MKHFIIDLKTKNMLPIYKFLFRRKNRSSWVNVSCQNNELCNGIVGSVQGILYLFCSQISFINFLRVIAYDGVIKYKLVDLRLFCKIIWAYLSFETHHSICKTKWKFCILIQFCKGLKGCITMVFHYQ